MSNLYTDLMNSSESTAQLLGSCFMGNWAPESNWHGSDGTAGAMQDCDQDSSSTKIPKIKPSYTGTKQRS